MTLKIKFIVNVSNIFVSETHRSFRRGFCTPYYQIYVEFSPFISLETNRSLTPTVNSAILIKNFYILPVIAWRDEALTARLLFKYLFSSVGDLNSKRPFSNGQYRTLEFWASYICLQMWLGKFNSKTPHAFVIWRERLCSRYCGHLVCQDVRNRCL